MSQELTYRYELGGWVVRPKRRLPSLSVSVPVPEASLDWHTANQIVWLIWCFLQLHQPYLDIEARLRGFPSTERVWSLENPEAPYANAVRESAQGLSPRFAKMPWFLRWLHQRVTDDHPDQPPPDSIKPFVARVDFIQFDLHIDAPIDATWETILKVLRVRARPEWKRLQHDYGVTNKRNRMPVNLLMAAMWLFMSDFLGWSIAKVADAQADILALRRGDEGPSQGRHRSDTTYNWWVEHFAAASYKPPLSLEWTTKKDPVDPEDLVTKRLRTAHKLLATDGFDFLLPKAS